MHKETPTSVGVSLFAFSEITLDESSTRISQPGRNTVDGEAHDLS